MQGSLLVKWGCGFTAGRKRGGRFTGTFLLFLLAGPLFAQKLSVSPALDFGSKVTTETGSNKFPVVYDNTGSASLVFTGAGITIEGRDAGDFRFEKTPTTTTMHPNAPAREVALGLLHAPWDKKEPVLCLLPMIPISQSQPSP